MVRCGSNVVADSGIRSSGMGLRGRSVPRPVACRASWPDRDPTAAARSADTEPPSMRPSRPRRRWFALALAGDLTERPSSDGQSVVSRSDG